MNILGYSDKFSVQKNEELQIKVSCRNIKTYNANLIKIVQGDINEKGPGYIEKKINVDLGGPFQARYQKIPIGSYGYVKNKKNFDKIKNIFVSVKIFPTLLKNKKEQTIFSKYDNIAKTGFELFIDNNNINFIVNNSKVKIIEKLHEKKWYLIEAGYDYKKGIIFIFCKKYDDNKKILSIYKNKKFINKNIKFSNNHDLYIASKNYNNEIKCFYNGKLDNLKFFIDDNISLSNKNKKIFIDFNFSKNISSNKIVDQSSNKLHGTLINNPSRGVVGFNWKENIRNWKHNPEGYTAIHFHDDDLTDCKWQTDFNFKIPKNIISGIYAIKLFNKKNEFYIPFCVRPKINSRKNKILFLMPTSSYLAYANNRIALDVPETEIVCARLIEITDDDLFLQENPEVGLSFYDVHNDGSPVYYSSKRRPILNFQPKVRGVLGGLGSNIWQFNADTHILGWLDRFNYKFDVICDSDLHKFGDKILKDYNVLITGSHPEYYSLKMTKSIENFRDYGGRLMYLGGNGFYWRISYDKNSSDIIECRKSEAGIRAVETHPGESYTSLTGEYTGLWRRNNYSPNKLVGVGMVSQGFDISSPYFRTKQSYNKKVRFIFEGIKENKIGNFGLSGGGAAGLEIDSYNHELGSPENAIVLASSKKHTDVYLMTPEDLLDPVPGISGTESENIKSDMVFFETKNNGAVFAVGSIAWGGSMAWNKYENNISLITKNVLDRFLNKKGFNKN